MSDLFQLKKILTSYQKLAKWGDGEWIEEVDFMEWMYKGIKCLVFRNGFGSLCGFIYVPKDHPWHGKNYEQIAVNVHGGLTYSREMNNQEHIIGFDCSHWNDLSPGLADPLIEARKSFNSTQMEELDEKLRKLKKFLPLATYKNISFVKSECESLVDQMLSIKDI